MVHDGEGGVWGILDIKVEVLKDVLVEEELFVVVGGQGGVGWLFKGKFNVWAPFDISILDHLVLKFGIVDCHAILGVDISCLIPDNTIVH